MSANLEQIAEEILAKIMQDIRLGSQTEPSFELRWVSSPEMQMLNQKYRGVNESTDVLSFPLYTYDELRIMNHEAGETANAQYAIRNTPPLLLGTLVLCEEEIIQRAQTRNEPAAAYLQWTVEHGVQHLLGYDHDESGEHWFPSKNSA